MLANTCDRSTQEAKAGTSHAWGMPRLHNKNSPPHLSEKQADEMAQKVKPLNFKAQKPALDP